MSKQRSSMKNHGFLFLVRKVWNEQGPLNSTPCSLKLTMKKFVIGLNGL